RTPPAAFPSINLYQSEPSTSPSAGVTAAHQVTPLIVGASVRTLPSARPTWMPPEWAVAARVGSQLPSLGWTWNLDPGPMTSGAPRATKTGTQNPVPNALPSGFMGGGSQGKKGPAQYAHAAPPSWNGSAIVVLEQRAYFSAWRMVFERPSVMSAMRVLPWGLGGLFCPATRALCA